ncbi:MAG: SLOG family protein, partial [Clostridia bacterium]|nr:SLOG family protein [Clostridia bacterium]
PYRNREAGWADKERIKYRRTLAKLDEIRCIYENYIGEECVLERNLFMVNNSSMLIALFNGLSGGRKSIIDYALRQGLEIAIIHS